MKKSKQYKNVYNMTMETSKNKKFKKIFMVSRLTDNKQLIEDLYDYIDTSFEPIQITIMRDKDKKTYIATSNLCGGGTQARNINKLLDNMKEVIWLIEDAKKYKRSKKANNK